MKRLALVIVMLVGALLLQAADDLPDWGKPDTPASVYLSPYYIQNSLADTAVPNFVTSLLGDYRGYDTMFETTVIFCAGITVLIILRRTPRRRPKEVPPRPEREGRDIILQTGARLLIPAMQIFALYVIAHGHHSPGGGFQGGVILGASFILLAMCYDLKAALGRLREKTVLICSAVGVMLYAGIGALCLAMGRNFLGYAALSRLLGTDEIMARSHGIFGVEIGVAITVMAIMFSLYIDLASGGDLDEGL
ncbi:MAG: hydrogen gas-evolving membrane-bound hydrogenase subunit E [Thermodesulfobacteriota bacterium]